MFGSLFELKNANFGIFLQPKIGNEGQLLISEAMFYGNCFTERQDLYTNIKSEMRSFKSNENIHKKEGGSYYVVSANKASSVTL